MKYKPEMICLLMMATFLSFNIFFSEKTFGIYTSFVLYTSVHIPRSFVKNIIKGAKILIYSSCLCLLSTGITDMYQSAQLEISLCHHLGRFISSVKCQVLVPGWWPRRERRCISLAKCSH